MVHYAHTSHGSQVLSGLEWLEEQDARYNVDIVESGPVVLPSDTTALRIYDGNNYPDNTYITPDMYWEDDDGISHTRSVINTGWFNLSSWTWCGQMSYYDETQIQQYLNVMAGFETEYPHAGFILMTGHTDGTGPGEALYRHNDMVRQYARDHNMVLFDFADIETYDPLGGGPYLNNDEGTCTWCEGFCAAHPAYCTDLPDYCAHSDSLPQATLFCKLKGQAFWWLLARIAGWDGTPANEPDLTPSYKAASRSSARQGERITYTVALRNQTGPLSVTALLTDTIPAGLAYVPGTLTATMGAPDDGGAPTLRWSGVFSPTPTITITFAVTVTATQATAITNAAVIAASGHAPITRTVAIIVNPHRTYLPLVLQNP